MINSAVYRISNINVDILDQSQTLITSTKAETSQIEKSSPIYFLQSYLRQLLDKKQKSMQQKNLSCRQLGKNIGYKFSQIISQNSFDRFLSSKDGKDSKSVKYVFEVKFLCQKVWVQLFNRKVDKLQFTTATNTFTFQDSGFRLIQHISHPVYEIEQEFIGLNFEMTCGIIEGVLNRFGHEVDVKYQDKAHSQFEVRFKTPGDTHFFSTY